MKKNLLTLLSFILISASVFANTVTIGEDADMASTYLPIAISSSTTPSFNGHYSVSQQLYFASEIIAEEPSSAVITAITFYYTSGPEMTRKLRVWMTNTDINAFSTETQSPNFVSPGTKVFSGDVSLTPGSPYTITFNTPYEWNGTNNIIVTVYDSTGVKNESGTAGNTAMIRTEGIARFLHKGASLLNWNIDGWDMTNLSNSSAYLRSDRGYVNKITFTFAEETVPAPTSPTAIDITATSATLGWTAAEGAESYEVRYGTTSGSLGDAINAGDGTSYSLTGLETSTKYYYQIRTKIGDAYSAWTDEANFTTSAHIHNAITFSKWNYSNILPTSAGNYYLAHDVTLSSDWGPAGSINLCLNGHRVYFGANCGHINGVTVAIYDFDGNGYITSSNTTQTLLVSGSTSLLFVDRDELVLNTAGGRKIIVASNGQAAIHSTIPFADDVNIDVHLTEYADVIIDAQIERSFTSASYNTICLPFALDNGALKQYFGNDYDLEEFAGASLEDETLSLTFASRTSLVAGKPYLIKPALNVANPTFEAVTLSATSPSSFTSDLVDFHGTFNPTELEGGNHNLLFLGADNELFWPESTANLKGFRAYFEIKGSAAQAAKRARIVKKEDSATGIEIAPFPSGEGRGEASKLLRDGMLLIERDGKTFNAQGQRIK